MKQLTWFEGEHQPAPINPKRARRLEIVKASAARLLEILDGR